MNDLPPAIAEAVRGLRDAERTLLLLALARTLPASHRVFIGAVLEDPTDSLLAGAKANDLGSLGVLPSRKQTALPALPGNCHACMRSCQSLGVAYVAACAR